MATADRFEHIHRQIWQQLQQATGNRRDLWRTPVLSTVDEDGLPDARTLVLRDVDPDGETLTLFSDRRSPKIGQLQQQPRCSLLFWCPTRRWQLRIKARATLETDTPRTEQIWQRIRDTAAAGDYLTAEAPSAPLAQPQTEMTDPALHNFCLLELQVYSIDWLALSSEGNRRVLLTDQQLTWLTP